MTIINVPITKGGSTVEIDTEKLPDAVYAEIVLQGLKVLLNRGMSKITKTSTKDADELKALSMQAAEKNVIAVYEGTIKFTGGKAKKASGAVMTEARRIAKGLVKDALKEEGIKISHVAAKEITALANQLIEADPSIVETAKANLEERAKKPIAIDIKSLVKVDPKLVAKADAKKAKDQLSAKQAGKVAKRAKPAAEATA